MARLRANDRFLQDRITERDVTIRQLVAQVNYHTQLIQRWTKEYPVLGRIEAKHLAEEQKRRDKAKKRAAAESAKHHQLPNEPAAAPTTEELEGLVDAARELLTGESQP